MNVSQPTVTLTTGSVAPRSAFRLGYRPPLDGLRGVAILAVIASHAGLSVGRAAFIGVDLFFVLSGFLITCLLIEEWDQRQKISLKSFYIRRALRLLPALLVLLGAVLAYEWIVHGGTSASTATHEALVALFYSTNWARAFGASLTSLFGHTWTLSIEEQFYLIWPVALLLLLRWNNFLWPLFVAFSDFSPNAGARLASRKRTHY